MREKKKKKRKQEKRAEGEELENPQNVVKLFRRIGALKLLPHWLCYLTCCNLEIRDTWNTVS